MKLKGSSLIFSIIILSFLLVSALSVATVSVTSRRSSLSSKNSNISFQVADSAAEVMLAKIYKDTGTISTPDGLGSCSSNQISGSAAAGTYKAVLFTKTGSIISCTDSLWRDNVAKIKFLGTYQNTTRAIEIAVTPPCNPVKDANDNTITYQVVLIGTQCWMSQNLNTGTMIFSSVLPGNNPTIEKWCYGDASANCTSKGGLYQWDEMMKYSTSSGVVQGICPTNWHIPTDTEFYTLENYLKDTAQTCDAARTSWDCATAGTKLKTGGTSVFESILAGKYDYSSSSFSGTSTDTYFWSSSSTGGVWMRGLSSGANTTKVNRNTSAKENGFSVRCLKD
ncbi:MAG: FISUMP domain-containing protein [Candidatus Moraniibacteriota bacterium]